MKIILPGGSGQIGTLLARDFHRDGHEVLVLSRNPRAAPWRVAAWNTADPGDWAQEFDGADVVINLAGRSVNCRYTAENQAAIIESRVASADANTAGIRTVALRSTMVMSADRGGIFATLLGLVRHGLGGTCGDGRQFVSWIHESDFIAAIRLAIERPALAGPLVIASPNPLPNRDFMAALRKAWGTRIGLPASRWMLEIGAFVLRTETELILKSRRVVPGRLLQEGFSFRHPHWPEAAEDLCARWRSA